MSCFDADGEGVFEALVAVGVVGEGDDLKTAVVLGEKAEDVLGLVGREIVDNDDFEVGVVLLEEVDEVLAEPVAVVLGGENHRDRREFCGRGAVFFARGAFVAAEAEEKDAIVKAKDEQTEGKQNGEHHGARVCKNMRKVHFQVRYFFCKNMYYFWFFLYLCRMKYQPAVHNYWF